MTKIHKIKFTNLIFFKYSCVYIHIFVQSSLLSIFKTLPSYGRTPWHIEVPRLGVKLELQLQVYDTAMATLIWAASVTYYTAACSNTGS